MKVRTLLMATVMLLTFSYAAFAACTFDVSSTPVTAVIQNGLTENAGTIVFAPTNAVNACEAGTITVTFPTPVTSPATAISVTGTGTFSGTVGLNTATTSTELAAGRVWITVPAVTPAAGDKITLAGIRVNIATSGVGFPMSVLISATINQITPLPAGTPQVILNAQPAITVGSTAVTVNTLAASATATAHMTAQEVFLNAFGGQNEAGNVGPTGGQPEALMVRFTLSGNPPSKVTLGFPLNAWALNSQFTLASSTGVPATAASTISSTSTSLVVYYKLTSGSVPTVQETLDVPVTVTQTGTCIGASNITFTATVAPIDATNTYIPRYQASESAAKALVTFVGSSTTLLIPYASVQTAINYDTGIAIANTTTDPGTAVTGITAPTAQTGGLTFYFYPTTGTAFNFKLPAGFGHGLDANGNLPNGGTMVALLSEIMTAARAVTSTIPTDFAGYLFVVTNFTNAHGFATVSNFTSYTQASPALVVNSNTDRSAETGLNN